MTVKNRTLLSAINSSGKSPAYYMWLSDEVWVTIDRADSAHVQCTRCSTEQTASNFTVFVNFNCVFVGVTVGTPAVRPKHDTGFAFRNRRCKRCQLPS
jgi:hypothetical protein